MARSLARLTVVLAVLAAASPALAQEKSRLGIGVSFSTLDLAQLSGPVPTTADVSAILDLGQFRLEPSLGIATYAIDAGPKGRDFNLGCGLLVPFKPGKEVSVYVGPRLFLGFVSTTVRAGATTLSDSGVDFTLAGVLGAEWFADPRFSIGAEARLSFVNMTELADGGGILRDAATVFGTSGHLYLRFYL